MTRNPEIPLPEFCPISRDWGVSYWINEMLLAAAKFQDFSFYRFWVIKGKPTGGSKLPPPQIRVNAKNQKNPEF